jgi:hypothetical protein
MSRQGFFFYVVEATRFRAARLILCPTEVLRRRITERSSDFLQHDTIHEGTPSPSDERSERRTRLVVGINPRERRHEGLGGEFMGELLNFRVRQGTSVVAIQSPRPMKERPKNGTVQELAYLAPGE